VVAARLNAAHGPFVATDRQPRRTPLARELAVVALRRQRATARQHSQLLRMPRSTVTRILARVGLARFLLV
jgi:hypothetical protein